MGLIKPWMVSDRTIADMKRHVAYWDKEDFADKRYWELEKKIRAILRERDAYFSLPVEQRPRSAQHLWDESTALPFPQQSGQGPMILKPYEHNYKSDFPLRKLSNNAQSRRLKKLKQKKYER